MMSDSFDPVSEDKLFVGRIREISGAPGSGIAQIYFDDGAFCHIESGHGLRVLRDAYGSLEKARGKTIRYETDDLNVMTYFEPMEPEARS